MSDEIVKRLTIIKNAVAIDEQDLVEMQLAKLKALELDERAGEIVDLIQQHRFESVMELIERYCRDRSGLVHYESPGVLGLKMELRALENQLDELAGEKIECERQIHAFNAEYMARVGDLYEDLLKWRVKYYSRRERPGEAEELGAAREQYESFRENNRQQRHEQDKTLPKDQRAELKRLYRKASRLCHPDKLADEFKDEGAELFKALNDAYRQQDLNKVKEILLALESGKHMNVASESLKDEQALHKKIAMLRLQLENLQEEVQALKDDASYRELSTVNDLDGYFRRVEQELREELNDLKVLVESGLRDGD